MGALQFLRRPFRYTPEAAGTRIDVSAAAPDFVALAQVPPLFLRMLLLSEDAGFFGHPGIDVAEIPVAWAANVERGGFARGASTPASRRWRATPVARSRPFRWCRRIRERYRRGGRSGVSESGAKKPAPPRKISVVLKRHNLLISADSASASRWDCAS